MPEPLFLSGVLQEKIWGGSKLKAVFGYDIPSEQTGELWAISAHKNGPAEIVNGSFAGQSLTELWDEHRELFDNQPGDVFPLLTKIIDAKTDLSVQVHPDDAYGLEHEGELGKTECWYIIDAEPGSQIVFGHHAKTRSELAQMIENGQWDELLRYENVQPGDFFYVPSGTIHAIGGGIMILETQQSSDTTYRVYDYDRPGQDGELRDLHISQSIDVATIPHQDQTPPVHSLDLEGGQVDILVDNEFFRVQKWQVNGTLHFDQDQHYTLVSILEGEGELIVDGQKFTLKKGEHFILPSPVSKWSVKGNLTAIASNPGK